jgi:cytochrome c oxidase subunit II
MAPLSYLVSFGARAASIATLTWGVLLISIAVTVIVSVLLAIAIWHRKPLAGIPGDRLPVSGSGGGMQWLWTGVGISMFVLVLTVGWTLIVLAKVNVPASRPLLTIEVTGHQWWWEVRYRSDDPGQRAGALPASGRGCDPLLLGTGAGRQDRYDPGADQ